MRFVSEQAFLRRTEIMVMSPNRYWCQGLAYLVQNGMNSNIHMTYCHSLWALTERLKSNPAISVVLTEEYGDDENMSDWLIFSNWVQTECPGLQTVMLRYSGRPGVDITSLRRGREYLEMASPIRGVAELLNVIKSGRFSAGKIPARRAQLTRRELYILKCLCNAENPVTLGKKLGITVKAISKYKGSALRKLGLKRLSPLLGHCQGLISLHD